MKYFSEHRTAKTLLIGYILLFAWAAVEPFDRATWWAENLPIMGIVLALVVLYAKRVRFSPAAYALMAILVYLHTIGGHFTFERVPFGFVTDMFGFERNHFDRVAHFTVGFYAYAIAEFLAARSLVRGKTMLFLFPVFTIAFVAMGYELIEWWFAVYGGNAEAGANFLGSQGDAWDAQKDMLMDTLGAIVAASAFLLFGRRPSERRERN